MVSLHPLSAKSASWLLLAIGLMFSGCNRPQEGGPTKEAITEKTSSGASAKPASIKPTAQQLGSIVKVQVICGELPPTEVTGALLHQEEFGGVIPRTGKDRLVVAKLDTWNEEQLRSPQAQIRVFRNITDSVNGQFAKEYRATLLQLDVKTGVAILAYPEDFEAGMDVGFRIARTNSQSDDVLLFTTSGLLPNALPNPPASALDIGAISYRVGEAPPTVLQQAIGADGNDKAVFLASSAPELLAGFVSVPKNGKGTLVAIRDLQLSVSTSLFEPVGVSVSGAPGQLTSFIITTKESDVARSPLEAGYRVVPLPAAGVDLSRPSDYGRLLESNAPNRGPLKFRHDPSKPNEWIGHVPYLTEKETESAHLVQTYWPLFTGTKTLTIEGKPFIVRLQREKDGVHPSVEGLPFISGKQEEQVPVREFQFESAVRNAYPMKGGNEILFELVGSPYWKRYSFTRNEWLPLPAVRDFSNVSIAGNLSSLFVLDRGVGEVRKYILPDLKPAGGVKLAGAGFMRILAGCNSDHAPVHVLTKTAMFSLSPKDLSRKDLTVSGTAVERYQSTFTEQDVITVAGDGLSFVSYQGHAGSPFYYKSDVRGLSRGDRDIERFGFPRGVTAAYRMGEWLRCIATPDGTTLETSMPAPLRPSSWATLAANGPMIFRINSGEPADIPPTPPKIECFPFFDSSPFASFDAPELAKVEIPSGGWTNNYQWIFFDSATFRIGTLAGNRTKWVVRDVVRAENPTQPILLNWPDTVVNRGAELRFKPMLLGKGKVTAELTSRPGYASVDTDGTVAVRIDRNESASVLLLSLKVAGETSGGITYPIPLHIVETPDPVIASLAVDLTEVFKFGTDFDSLGRPANGLRPLPATVHAFNNQILDIQSPLPGYIALITDSNRVDIFSLEHRKVTASIAAPTGARYFAGAEALFEYDPGKRSITRISMPEARRDRSITLPGNVTLSGLAIGKLPTSPLTVLLDGTIAQSSGRVGDVNIVARQFQKGLSVLDNRSLQVGGWAQPVPLAKLLGQRDASTDLNFLITDGPLRFPSSHNGQIVTMPGFFLALGGGLSVAHPLDEALAHKVSFSRTDGPLIGSISGMIAGNSSGEIYTGGTRIKYTDKFLPRDIFLTPCGRYRLLKESFSFQVRLAENDNGLFRLGRIPLLADAGGYPSSKARIFMLGDDGPLAVLGDSGKVLQLIEFSIPKLARELNPTELHVTSQPPPCLVEGGTLQYQVETNNPEVFASCQLFGDVAGAVLTPQGLLRFTAPKGISAPTKVNISIEVTSKSGQKLVHEFPLFVLPLPKPGTASKTGAI